jgi:hypothetical protein
MHKNDFMTKSISDFFMSMIEGIINYIERHYDEKPFIFDDEFVIL